MTRKDYQLLAGHISQALRNCDITHDGVGQIADALEYDNHRFNRRRFYEACGVEGE